MFCTYCGKEISPNETVCPGCGAAVSTQGVSGYGNGVNPPSYPPQNTPAAPYYGGSQHGYGEAPRPYAPAAANEVIYPDRGTSSMSPTSVLVWGIVAAAFASSFFLSFLGIIFGAIARGKYRTYADTYGLISGQVKAGGILGKVAIIVGIVLTVFLAIYFIVLLSAIL